MRSNYQMLNDFLKEFNPKERGILHNEEVWEIKKKLCLIDMDKLALQNMRDFSVMYIGCLSDKAEEKGESIKEVMRLWDIMSGITGVIDALIFSIEANEEYR